MRKFCPWAGRVLWVVWVSVAPDPATTAAPRPPWTTGRVVGSPGPPAPFTVERVLPGLRLENPVDLAVVPGTDRFLVAEQGGRFWSLPGRHDPEVSAGDLALDLPRHRAGIDSVLGFAFHPGFVTNRFVFINYNEPGGRPEGSHIARFTMTSLDPPVIDPGSERTVLRWPSGGHNGCSLAFGRDGLLFVSTGDAASPDPPDGVARTGQDLSDLLAAVLRIDVDRPPPGAGYAVPPDNPFVHTPGARPEVWAFGFRNPFRMSVDPGTGDLWVGDVGWEQWEMIYRIQRGGNYGWAITEGPNRHVRTDVTPGPGPILPPLVALPHSEAASITGGRVYHGRRLERLRGAYVYGDWETGKFWALRQDAGRLLANEELCDTTLKPVAFAEDPEGELVILDYNGGLYRFVPRPPPAAASAFPRRLSDTGLFRDTARFDLAPGVAPYHPAAGMWSDHATAERVVAIPGADRIMTADGRETIAGRMWYFPSNTVFARTLSLEMERGAGSSRRRVETQLLHYDGQAWNGYSYRWNEAGTDADLVEAGGTNTVLRVSDPEAPGGWRETPWRFLGRAECLRCHNAWAGDLLSFNWPQLGRPQPGSESLRLADLGVLEVRQAPADLARLVDPYDAAAALEDRARSWLHVNCSGCHRFGAGGGVDLRFNLEIPPPQWRAVDARPTRGDFGILDARIIAPGDPGRSVLFHRVTTEGAGHMPQVGSRLFDRTGVLVVAEWIRSLPAPTGAPGVGAATRGLVSELDALEARAARGEAAAATARLLATMNGALALIERLDRASPRASPPWLLIREAAVAAARSHTNAFIRDLYQRWLAPGERRVTLGAEVAPASVLGLRGDPGRGAVVFAGTAQCVRCHVLGGVGRAYGPDLTALGARYRREEVLDHVLRPSQTIAPGFRTTIVTLDDESEVSGFLVSSNAARLVLRDDRLTEVVLARDRIREARESAVSAMPEGLLAALTAQEAADLLEYLVTVGRAR